MGMVHAGSVQALAALDTNVTLPGLLLTSPSPADGPRWMVTRYSPCRSELVVEGCRGGGDLNGTGGRGERLTDSHVGH
jgi:hypothetical protein